MTLPDFSATTPKVSLFEFKSMGEELITTSVKQTEKFSKIAVAKVNFMKVNQGGAFPAVRFTPCVVLNATGVRLSLKAFTGQTDYPAPSLIEPGECASFLAPGEAGTITYEVQVFEGPFAGWKAPDTAGVPPKDVSIRPFELTYPVAGAIKYGDKIKLVNQYTDVDAVPNAGYLDTYGNLGILGGARAFGVQTGRQSQSSAPRGEGTSTWQLIPNFDPNAATSSVSPSTALAFVQDMKNPDKPFETTLTWTTNGQALPVNEFKLTQSVAH